MKLVRIAIYSFIFCLLAVIASLFLVDTSHIATLITSEIESSATHSDWNVQFSEPTLALVGINSGTLSLRHRRYPLAFKLDGVRVRLPILALLTGTSAANFQGELYSGAASGNARSEDNRAELFLELSQVHIAEHPQLAGLGISTGTLSGKSRLDIQENQLLDLDSDMNLAGLNKPQKTVLSAHTLSLPFDISVPPIRDLNLSCHIKGEPSQLAIEQIDLTSSLGSAKGELTLRLVTGKISSMNGKFSIHLSADGKAFWPFLPLASSGALQSSDGNFEILLSGSPSSPRAVFRKI